MTSPVEYGGAASPDGTGAAAQRYPFAAPAAPRHPREKDLKHGEQNIANK